MNQRPLRQRRPRAGLLLCPANAYINLRKAQAALNILLNAIHLGAELDGLIPGTGPLAKINSVWRLCGILFPNSLNVVISFFPSNFLIGSETWVKLFFATRNIALQRDNSSVTCFI